MLELQKLTRIENGEIVGPMCPVTSAENFLAQTVGAQLFALWRICGGVSFKDGGEVGTGDLLVALIGGRALVILLDIGVDTCGVALRNNGKAPEIFKHWRDEFVNLRAPSDDELREVLTSIDVDAEIEAIRAELNTRATVIA